MEANRPWEVVRPYDLIIQVKQLPKSVKQELFGIMNKIIYSSDPTNFGVSKNTRFGLLYIVSLNNSKYRYKYRYRMIYQVHSYIRMVKIIKISSNRRSVI